MENDLNDRKNPAQAADQARYASRVRVRSVRRQLEETSAPHPTPRNRWWAPARSSNRDSHPQLSCSAAPRDVASTIRSRAVLVLQRSESRKESIALAFAPAADWKGRARFPKARRRRT